MHKVTCWTFAPLRRVRFVKCCRYCVLSFIRGASGRVESKREVAIFLRNFAAIEFPSPSNCLEDQHQECEPIIITARWIIGGALVFASRLFEVARESPAIRECFRETWLSPSLLTYSTSRVVYEWAYKFLKRPDGEATRLESGFRPVAGTIDASRFVIGISWLFRNVIPSRRSTELLAPRTDIFDSRHTPEKLDTANLLTWRVSCCLIGNAKSNRIGLRNNRALREEEKKTAYSCIIEMRN